ncbi:MAG: Maf family protein [Eubacteriales bacterium]|nr:Maf family protein [Eubacteriales bacterium]
MIILASNSPRRKELLSLAGLEFAVDSANADETLPEGMTNPKDVVEYLSKVKASEIKDKESIIIGADTVVAVDNMILGKPEDEQSARQMLGMLSGKVHSVFTGVTIMHPQGEITFSVETKVEFYPLTSIEIEDYIATGEPMDKAGSYGIQGKGGLFIKRIEGDYFNVVGLPLARTVRELKNI